MVIFMQMDRHSRGYVIVIPALSVLATGCCLTCGKLLQKLLHGHPFLRRAYLQQGHDMAALSGGEAALQP